MNPLLVLNMMLSCTSVAVVGVGGNHHGIKNDRRDCLVTYPNYSLAQRRLSAFRTSLPKTQRCTYSTTTSPLPPPINYYEYNPIAKP